MYIEILLFLSIIQYKQLLLLICYAAIAINAENLERFFEMKKNHYRIWKVIGTELGIDGDTLSAIEKDHRDDKDRLHAVIDSASPAPTREAMTKILQSANISSAIAGMIKLPPPFSSTTKA